MNESQARAHVWVTGRVQGVFFRQQTAERAQAAGLGGWVRNAEDGRVEAVFEGGRRDVDRLVEWCHSGPSRALVSDVRVSWEEPEGERSFRVTP